MGAAHLMKGCREETLSWGGVQMHLIRLLKDATRALQKLPAEEISLIWARFGFDGSCPRSRGETARLLGISLFQAALLEARALQRLRQL